MHGKPKSLPHVCSHLVFRCYSFILSPARRLQECLHEHGGGKVGQVWYDGDVPLFLVNFHTRMALRKLVAGKSELEKKLMTKLRSKSQLQIYRTNWYTAQRRLFLHDVCVSVYSSMVSWKQ